jgi:RNA polymerase sigma-70 factor (ECF subfamily)
MPKAVLHAGSPIRSTMTTPDDFSVLLSSAKKGDEDAFATMWRIFQPGLLRYLRVIGGQAADDLASDTWVQVTRKLSTFQGDDKAFRAWLYTIARHRHIDWRRQTTRRKESLVEIEVFDRLPGSDDTSGSLERAISTQEAVALIATLPADQAEAVMLRTVSGLPVSVVAEIMNRPAGTIRVLCHRGLRRLARTLEGTVPDKASEAKNSQATEVVV